MTAHIILQTTHRARRIDVDVLTTPAALAQGYRGRLGPMNDYTGLLFVFPDFRQHVFTMMGVPFDLDIVWFDLLGTAVGAATMQANTRQIYQSSTPNLYAIELAAGWVFRNGLPTRFWRA